MIGRRHLTLWSGAAFAGLLRPARAASLPNALAAIEATTGGRLGVAMHDTGGSGPTVGYRLDERFPMCSTFKLLATAAVLARVDAGTEQLDRRIRFTAAEVVAGSPMTKPQAGGPGMTLAQLCEAAITLSDNTAANLMLASMGGPAGLTRFIRAIGDGLTRLDRTEPTLNEAIPGDLRDTTTPTAMLHDMQALVLGERLSPACRTHLVSWLQANKTGGARLRAGLPADWKVGDKTGTGQRGTANDVGVLWPPNRPPILVAVYLTGSTVAPEQRDAAIASVARTLAAAVAG